MLRFLRRVLEDLKKGENIDHYLTVIAAIVLTTLNLAGIASNEQVAALTLAVLALFAFSSLGNRHRIDELVKSLVKERSNFFNEKFPASFETDFINADEIWLVGVSLARTINSNYITLERKLRRGGKVKVLLVHPEGPALEIAVSRNYVLRNAANKRSDIIQTLQLLCNLKESTGGSLQIRTIENPLSYGATVINPNTGTGILYLEHYTFRVSSDSIPRFVLQPKDTHWYDFFKKEIEALWDYGTEWNCEASSSESAKENSVATSTIPINEVFIEEFKEPQLNEGKWLKVEYSDAAIISDGALHLNSLGNSTSFPYIISRTKIIPETGAFSIKIGFQYAKVTGNGTGIVVTSMAPNRRIPLNDASKYTYAFRVWQDVQGLYVGKTKVSINDSNYHIVDFRWLEERIETHFNDEIIESRSTSNTPRPSILWMGNQVYLGSKSEWTTFRVIFIETTKLL